MNLMNPEPRKPLFIVGMPRSGTKLLRSMLNQHPQIRFANIETEFFPFWVANWHRFGQIDSPGGFERFYRNCRKLPFFVQNAERGIDVKWEQWYRACEAYLPAAVFDALMRCVLAVSPEDQWTIWGDKSPSYIRHVPVLARQFPEAEIIHIVRDVRDYSLSINKAWGKSMLRAAQRWQDDVSRCRADGRQVTSSAYLEVRYEELLAEPERTLRRICARIGISMDERMLVPGEKTEDLGDAKGSATILTGNIRKYEQKMSPRMVQMIERIACPTLRELDYPCTYTGKPVRLSAWKEYPLQVADGFNLVRSAMSKRGFIGAFRFQLNYFRTSGNRTR